MQNKLKVSLQLVLLFLVAVLACAACSSQPTAQPPGTSSATGTTGAAGATQTGSTAGVGGSDSTATTGMGGMTVGAGGATGTGGAGTGTGGAGPPVGTACMAFTPVRANVLQPVDPGVATLLQSMTTAQKLAIESGDPTICGAPAYNCDFDATGVPTTNPVIPPFRMRDGPRGVHNLAGGPTTTWAIAEARAASFDDNLEFQVGQVQAQEMRALKFDLSLSPVINTLRHPGWARAQETYGEDPLLVGKMGAAFTRGLQGGPDGVAACPKHFVGNDTDNNRASVISTMDEQTLRENYALPFQIVVEEADPACIMAAYNGVNGNWSAESAHLLTDLVRTDWKWTGFMISDWWATKGHGVMSMNAGLDLEMPDQAAFVQLPAAVGTTVMPARIDQAATRILNARIKFRELTAAYVNSPLNSNVANTVQASKDLARKTEEEGAVLLKNDGVLPLGPKATTIGSGLATVGSILFLGPDRALPNTNAHTAGIASGLGDRGSSDNFPPYAISFVQGVTAHPAAAGITITQSANAADAVGKDVVIIPVAMAHEDEGEAFDGGRDRQDLRLNGAHPIHWGATKPSALIAAAATANPNAKIVVLLAVGSAIVMEDWWTRAHAIVQTFYPGQEGGTALARLLFGDITFSGKLPFTVAQAEADYPAFQNNGNTAQIDYFHGYRKIEQDAKTARFWFGYGLSYNTYEYSALQVLCPDGISTTGRLDVQVTVKNNGKMVGDEIVQLYIGYPNSTIRHPKKELKAYTRVTLMPGESKQVALSVAAKDMAHWNNATNQWVIERVPYTVLVGPSADPTKLLSAAFTIN